MILESNLIDILFSYLIIKVLFTCLTIRCSMLIWNTMRSIITLFMTRHNGTLSLCCLSTFKKIVDLPTKELSWNLCKNFHYKLSIHSNSLPSLKLRRMVETSTLSHDTNQGEDHQTLIHSRLLQNIRPLDTNPTMFVSTFKGLKIVRIL